VRGLASLIWLNPCTLCGPRPCATVQACTPLIVSLLSSLVDAALTYSSYCPATPFHS
jgi:hypothetical protein